MLIIRSATTKDAERLAEIYAPYVLETSTSYETVPPGAADMRARVMNLSGRLPWLVAEQDGKISGYAYAGRLGERAGYDWSCTASIYIDAARRSEGLGQALYTALFALLKAQGYRTVYALISTPNPQSEAFHQKLGFEQQGHLKHAGYKFGHVIGIAYYAKELLPVMENPPRPVPYGALPDDIIENALKC